MLTCEREIGSTKELIELMSMNATNVHSLIACGEQYSFDEGEGVYVFKKMTNLKDGTTQSREYVQLRRYEQSF
jgi:hypothetical protein